MEKKLQYVTAAALGAAGAGAALALTRKAGQEKRQAAIRQAQAQSGYRNTERGKNHKNRKGIYYSSGNYEAFARPEKPAGRQPQNR